MWLDVEQNWLYLATHKRSCYKANDYKNFLSVRRIIIILLTL
jgi:hypothetical protein